jgi:hypothetical protein
MKARATAAIAIAVLRGCRPHRATRLSAATYYLTVGKPDSKISEAPHG